MTWQARRRFGLRERSRSSLLPAALAHHHAQPCASRSTSQPAQSQLSHRTGRRRFASGMPAAWSPQRQELFFTQIGALHVPRLVVARRIRRLAHCQSTRVPPLFTTDLKDCSLQFNSVVFVHRGSVCCVSSQTETPIGPPRLTQRTDGCLLVS